MTDSPRQSPARSPYDEVDVKPLEDLCMATSGAAIGERLRFQEDLGFAGTLDAAFVRRHSDVLVVTFHGLLDREKFSIPRFERARMTEEFNVSCLYWADPSLRLDPDLALAWYTGAKDFDLFPTLARHSVDVARSIGARHIIFSGSSGGGFAALQTSALVPGSTALVFNPQTAISLYWLSVQRKYLNVCMPDGLAISPDEFDFSFDWSAGLGDRYSAIRRYSKPTPNRVIYWSNVNDWHHSKHLQPFRKAVESASNPSEVLTIRTYEGPKTHNVPNAELFTEALEDCLRGTH